MPLFLERHDIQTTSIFIWKIEEQAEFFISEMPWHQKQLDWLDSIHPVKKLEYLASRYLIYKITGKLDSHLYKDEAGKLHLEDSNQHLSISHSGEWVGLALSHKVVGFDLQKISSKIRIIAKRFLNEEEYQLISKINSEQLFIIAWTIKESVYKANGKKGILFSEQIQLDISKLKSGNPLIETAYLNLIDLHKTYNIHHDWTENFGWSMAVSI